jgi:DNA topoisomerase-2
MDMTTYLNSELRDFSKYAMVRATASVIDGFKISQRKIFFAAVNKFRNNGNQKFKVAQLGAHAAALTNYAHGEVSLQDAIIKMAQDFPGSNNMNLLEPRGAFGSRLANGDDAASPRYIFTRLSDFTTKVFSPTDDRVLENVVEEGMAVEPKYYTPSLPMVLINGARGIGTAFSSYVPSFNPSDIRDLVLRKISDPDALLPEPTPWFDGYSTNSKTKYDGSRWTFYGNYKSIGPGKIVIDELPIYTAIDAYKTNVLGPLLDSKTITKIDVEHDIARNKPRFVIQHNLNTENEEEIMKTLKLIKTAPSTNMNLLDENNNLINFKSVQEIVNYWYKIKFGQLKSRKTAVLTDMEKDIHMHQHKLRFLNGVLENKIKIKESKQSVINDMSKLGISEQYHDQFLRIPIVNLTADMIKTLNNAIKNKQRDYDVLKSKSVSIIFREDVQSVFGESSKKRKAESSSSYSKKPKTSQKINYKCY